MPKNATIQKDGYLHFFVSILVLITLLLTGYNLYSYSHRKTEVLGIKSDPLQEKLYWQELLTKNPSYRDAWIQIAKIDLETGDTGSAAEDLQKAKTIDPNSTKVLTFEKELSKR